MGPKKHNNGENQKIAKSIRLDEIHWEIIRGLIPFYGNSEPEVVRTIVQMWLHENIGSNTIRKLDEIHAINLKNMGEVYDG